MYEVKKLLRIDEIQIYSQQSFITRNSFYSVFPIKTTHIYAFAYRAVNWSMIIPVPYKPDNWDAMEALKILDTSQMVGIDEAIWQLGTGKFAEESLFTE